MTEHLALDAPCGSPACRGQRCTRLRHGYVGGVMSGRCSQHRGCRQFELDELAALDAEFAPIDGPAGGNGGPGVVLAVAGDALPGTKPVPDFGGHGTAAPPAAGTAAEAPVLPRASAVRVALGTAWLCRLDRATATEPGACSTCGGRLVRHRIYAEEATDG